MSDWFVTEATIRAQLRHIADLADRIDASGRVSTDAVAAILAECRSIKAILDDLDSPVIDEKPGLDGKVESGS